MKAWNLFFSLVKKDWSESSSFTNNDANNREYAADYLNPIYIKRLTTRTSGSPQNRRGTALVALLSSILSEAMTDHENGLPNLATDLPWSVSIERKKQPKRPSRAGQITLFFFFHFLLSLPYFSHRRVVICSLNSLSLKSFWSWSMSTICLLSGFSPFTSFLLWLFKKYCFY